MSKEPTTSWYVAEAIEHLWENGKTDPTVREITTETYKNAPISVPLMQIIRSHIGGALRVLSEMGSLAHPVTAYYYKLPIKNGVRRIPLDTISRRKCVPLVAGPKGTAGVRKVEAQDDPLLLEALTQSKLMTAGSVKELEKRQQEATDTGLLSQLLADVRDPSWFDQALLTAAPQLTLPISKATPGEDG